MITGKIKAFNKGLVRKNNRITRILDEGRFWLAPGEELEIYDLTKPFNPAQNIQILLQHEQLAACLETVVVNADEIVLRYENGQFAGVLAPGTYAFWKGVIAYKFVRASISKIEITEPIDRSTLVLPEVQAYIRTYVVEVYEKALLFKDGKFFAQLESGVYYFWKNPIILTVYKADMRKLSMEMNGQEILTRDKANLRINFSLQYQVEDIVKAVNNKEYDKQLYVLAQLALREMVATYTLDELLEKRNALSAEILEKIAANAGELGVKVLDCGIRDIIFPGDIKDIMNQVLVAEKKTQANIIMRREETASTRSLLNTAKLMEENVMLFKLKEMEYVEKIADKINTISVNGSGDIIGQLKQIFSPKGR
jgi:hypothetical protein